MKWLAWMVGGYVGTALGGIAVTRLAWEMASADWTPVTGRIVATLWLVLGLAGGSAAALMEADRG